MSSNQLIGLYSLTGKIVGTCFDKCVAKLYDSMDRQDEQCVGHCVKNFIAVQSFLIKGLLDKETQ